MCTVVQSSESSKHPSTCHLASTGHTKSLVSNFSLQSFFCHFFNIVHCVLPTDREFWMICQFNWNFMRLWAPFMWLFKSIGYILEKAQEEQYAGHQCNFDSSSKPFPLYLTLQKIFCSWSWLTKPNPRFGLYLNNVKMGNFPDSHYRSVSNYNSPWGQAIKQNLPNTYSIEWFPSLARKKHLRSIWKWHQSSGKKREQRKPWLFLLKSTSLPCTTLPVEEKMQ